MGTLGLSKMDVVYLVKDTPTNLELKYSLRSVAENLPHRKVWLIGGCPNFVNREMVNYCYSQQKSGVTKWNNTNRALYSILDNDGISENFILFNDDFFVMKPTRKIEYYFDRTIDDRISDFLTKFPTSRYVQRLKSTKQALQRHGIDKPLNFELHLPMVLNKTNLRKIYENYGDSGAKRTIYGNLYAENPVQHKDVKFYRIYSVPSTQLPFVSTADGTFALGIVGKVIRNRFVNESKYELKGVE